MFFFYLASASRVDRRATTPAVVTDLLLRNYILSALRFILIVLFYSMSRMTREGMRSLDSLLVVENTTSKVQPKKIFHAFLLSQNFKF
jgi:hypothetical protein